MRNFHLTEQREDSSRRQEEERCKLLKFKEEASCLIKHKKYTISMIQPNFLNILIP